ncbi:hypothetical protein ACQVP2_28190 [Methylobacterium aquaticum]|uniref:hypothetical protein n=1 Tax=Methylobacterium aquaticum TaxID=270351 RepID=UPI003D184685
MNGDQESSELNDLWEDPEFEEFAERLWSASLSAARQHWDENDSRHLMPIPESFLAKILTTNKYFSLEMQNYALKAAAEIGEEMIRDREIELVEMRRALEALRQPRPNLIRSTIAAIKPDDQE